MTDNICIIPARMASGRYPGKPLAPILSVPLVLHVWHRCRMAKKVARVVIATCDREIKEAVEAAGGEVVMTAATHPGCVDRTEEAVNILGAPRGEDSLVLMVQGDEILVTPESLDDMVGAFERDRPPVLNLASRLYREEDFTDPNTVKVVMAEDGRALYFSREPIPSRSRAPDGVDMYQQTGIIGFTRSFLHTFGTLPRTPLERLEHIDMLRALEHGHRVQMVKTERETLGVDTPADRDRAERLLADDPLTKRYLPR